MLRLKAVQLPDGQVEVEVSGVGEPCFVPDKTPAQVLTQAHQAPIFLSTHGSDACTQRLVFRTLPGNSGVREMQAL
jgi:hypothetical protein